LWCCVHRLWSIGRKLPLIHHHHHHHLPPTQRNDAINVCTITLYINSFTHHLFPQGLPSQPSYNACLRKKKPKPNPPKRHHQRANQAQHNLNQIIFLPLQVQTPKTKATPTAFMHLLCHSGLHTLPINNNPLLLAQTTPLSRATSTTTEFVLPTAKLQKAPPG